MLNTESFPVKSYKSGHFNIVAGTAANTNADGSGTLNLVVLQGTSTPLSVTDRGDIRKIQISVNGNVATATVVRFYRSTSPTAPTTSNTVYLTDMTIPVTTLSSTTPYTPVVLPFEAGEFPLDAGEYLYCAPCATLAGGADVIVHLNKYDA